MRISVISWRDLDHPDAGGSELHLAEILRRWAAKGHAVTLWTSAVPGGAPTIERDGYLVHRRGGPWSVFLRAPFGARSAPRDALVEVWHGVNFLSPVWARGRRMGIEHHVHGHQFRLVLPKAAAIVAEVLERKVYPRVYRGTALVTLSPSSRTELIELGYPPEHVTVVSPGVSDQFSPGGEKSERPSVIAVARGLMKQKRAGALIEMLAQVRENHPKLEAVIVGDGPARATLPRHEWLQMPGRVSDAQLVDLYRRAWVLASASTVEGWGMTVTEAAACGTPSVVTDIAGHRDAVVDGVTGFVAQTDHDIVRRLDQLLGDEELRSAMGAAAIEHARQFGWDAAADRMLALLVS